MRVNSNFQSNNCIEYKSQGDRKILSVEEIKSSLKERPNY